MIPARALPILAGLLAGIPGPAAGGEGPAGFFSLEHRAFPRPPLFPSQVRHFNSAMALEIGYATEAAGFPYLVSKGFVRVDEHDPERTRFDVKELHLDFRTTKWALSLGANQVFWGVAESRHLVDVINQVDLAGDLDMEDKLGQTLFLASFNSGTGGRFDFFAMTLFRPRPFPGTRGRPGIPIPLAESPDYESSLGRWQPDWALRWSHSLGALDWAVEGFHGTAREPRLLPGLSDGGLILRTRYEVILQGGAELQWTSGAWQWKLEALSRQGQGPYFTAMTAGFEYLVADIYRGTSLSPMLEYNHDDRKNATVNIYDNDLFAGFRIDLNDLSDTRIKGGALTDLEGGTVLGTVEGNRRFGESWKVLLEGRFFSVRKGDGDFLGYFRRDHHVRAELERHF